MTEFMETPPDPGLVPTQKPWWDPNVDLALVSVTMTRWEARKALGAIRRRRRYTVKRGRSGAILDGENGTPNPDAVEGAALWRAEAAFDAALGAQEARP